MNERAAQRWPFRWFFLVLVLALIVNAVFMFILPSGGAGSVFSALPEKVGESVYTVSALGEDEIVLATLGNELSVRKGNQILAQATVPAAVFGVVYLPKTQEILVGASDAKVYVYDRRLSLRQEIAVPSGVLGMAALEDGWVAVAHGVGAYGDRFYVSFLNPQRQVVNTYQVGVRINAFGSLNNLGVYGTDEARIGAVDADGNLRWEIMGRRKITSIAGWPENNLVLAGDMVGNLYYVDLEGNLIKEVNLTQFRLYAIRPLSEDMVAVGDDDGGLYLLDNKGQLLLAQPTVNVKDPVATIYLVDKGRAMAVRQSGQAFMIDPETLKKAQLAQTLRPFWIVLDVLAVLALIVTLIRAQEPWKRAANALLGRIYRARAAYLFLLPSFIFIAIWVYVATGMAIFYSTTDYVPGDPIRFVGMDNFVYIFTKDMYFWKGFGNMILLLVTSVIKVLTMPLAVALLVFHLRSPKAQYVWRTVFLLPSVVPGVVLTMMWKMIYDPGTHGFVNAVLRAINLPQYQRAWLGDEKTALWAIIFAGFPWVGAFPFLIYLGGLININTELFDAAAIDGVNWWKRLIYVEWPLIAPQRNLLLFFTYLGAIQSYEGIWIYTQGGPGHATYVPALQLFLNLSQGMKIGYASAIGFVLFLMVLTVTIVNRRLQARSQTAM